MLKIKILPANCGDCILISFDDKNGIKNILVDGGAGKVYENVLKNEVIKIKNKKQKIDLLIVTHIDNDHIGGIIKFIEDDEYNDCIETVWFNSWTNYNHKAYKLSNEGNTVSASHARTLENKLKELNIWCNKEIKQGIEYKFEKAKITVVSPDNKNLENLVKYIKDEFEVSETDDRSKSIEFLQQRIFKEDIAIPNGSSIAFIFEYETNNQKRKILFTGDSFPSVVLAGLKETQSFDKNEKIKFDYVKLSHHASKYNTSDELLKYIKCKNYIITTQGCNGKPNKETFARILKYHKPINLFFNYKNEKIVKLFSPDEIKNLNINYLSENKEQYIIEVC